MCEFEHWLTLETRQPKLDDCLPLQKNEAYECTNDVMVVMISMLFWTQLYNTIGILPRQSIYICPIERNFLHVKIFNSLLLRGSGQENDEGPYDATHQYFC